MILIAGYVKYQPGAIEKLKSEMLKMVSATRAEDGCINYDFCVDITDPAKLIVFERWRDQKALDGHINSKHMAEWRKAGAAAGPAERNLSLWEVSEGRKL
jgi:quinol monooxygenase YgiN